MSSSDLIEALKLGGLEIEQAEDCFQLMLWYGIVGLRKSDGSSQFVYDVEYKTRRMQAEMRQPDYTDRFVFNAAVYPAIV